MTSPLPPGVSEHEMAMHRLITPTARILSAAVILITGMGISAIFWKMPNGNAHYALYHDGIIDSGLMVTPLPSESIALLSLEERKQVMLPELEVSPVADGGIGKYTQVYEPPASVAVLDSESRKIDSVVVEVEPVFAPVVPQKFEPMRPVIEEKPIAVESVSLEFQPKPTSVSTVEKSDELLSMFLFAENSRVDFDRLAESDSAESDSAEPIDPFSGADSFSRAVVSASELQPLKPIQLERLSPLLPLQESDLPSLSALIAQ